ncbi:MAG: tryptophan--tRNA ligase [Phycisphaeraceae bacterium]|nr:tryptophan--tRNA ligase [Phycisphaeraceae bacterium]
MKRVLSGLQPSGQLHLGNYAGAIKQFIAMQDDHEMFVFVASYHALTSARDADELRANIRQVVVDYLAFGLDPKKTNIYLQQDVPQVTELAWLLSCVCPKHMMDKATSFKDKTAKGLAASIGLYTYPILQAADILSVDPDLVPVGEDQRQHIEITRDLAQKFNHHFASEEDPVFKIPDAMIRTDSGAVVPGIDGQKMSKSYNNGIDPFMDEKPLRKRIMKIVSDSTPVDQPKDPDCDTTYQIFTALVGKDDERAAVLRDKYVNPPADGFGYGHAKQALFELILDEFGEARKRRIDLMNDAGYVEEVLKDGAAAASERVAAVTARARAAAGL